MHGLPRYARNDGMGVIASKAKQSMAPAPRGLPRCARNDGCFAVIAIAASHALLQRRLPAQTRWRTTEFAATG